MFKEAVVSLLYLDCSRKEECVFCLQTFYS
jgi:hypothetical protein